MKVVRRPDAPEGPMLPDHFAGAVSRRDYGAIEDPEGSALEVSFPAGARTHWHSHPGGQVLFVTDGRARVGTRDGRVERLSAGDLAYAPPDEEHWHGAEEDVAARHLAFSFGATAWGEPVED